MKSITKEWQDHRKFRNKDLLLFGLANLSWLIFRTGTKPSRIVYPCQRAALANTSVLIGITIPLWLILIWTKTEKFLSKKGKALALLIILASAMMNIGQFLGSLQPAEAVNLFQEVPLDLRPQNALNSTGASNLFFVTNASGFEGNMDEAVARLLRLMASRGLYFYKTIEQPTGLIAKDDVVLIKVNSQWPQRGGTNTDLVKSIIKKIVNHPEGFFGEVVVADNGQGYGSLNWPESNAFNHSQSHQAVVNTFASYKVSTWLWDTIRMRDVAEYERGDFRDGYIVNRTLYPVYGLPVSYPKFKTRYGTYISFKKGIWSNETRLYDSEKLKIINVPVLKSHSVYGVTASVKHYMGVASDRHNNAHNSIAVGGMGSEMVETRFPDLNILDAVWVNPNPVEGYYGIGPSTSYSDASFTNVIGVSQDPVALDYWASKHILIPAAIYRGYTRYSSLDPDYMPRDPALRESFHNYLARSMSVMKKAGYKVTMDSSEMNIYVARSISAKIDIDPDVLNLETKGKWITTYIELPESYNACDTDLATVVLNETLQAESFPIGIGDYDNDTIPDLMVKFNRTVVSQLIYSKGFTNGSVVLVVKGMLIDGTTFEGRDVIKVRFRLKD